MTISILEKSQLPKAMSTLYRIACVSTQKPYISDSPSGHKGIAYFGTVFTTERRCAASILKVNPHISDRFLYHSLASCEQVPDRSRSQ